MNYFCYFVSVSKHKTHANFCWGTRLQCPIILDFSIGGAVCGPGGHVTQPHVHRLLAGLPVANPVYEIRSSFLSGRGWVFLGSRSGGLPSGSPNLVTFSEQYL